MHAASTCSGSTLGALQVSLKRSSVTRLSQDKGRGCIGSVYLPDQCDLSSPPKCSLDGAILYTCRVLVLSVFQPHDTTTSQNADCSARTRTDGLTDGRSEGRGARGRPSQICARAQLARRLTPFAPLPPPRSCSCRTTISMESRTRNLYLTNSCNLQ